MTEFEAALLERLASIEKAILFFVNGGKPVEPNFERPFEEYPTFDWSSIGATVIKSDEHGPTHVQHDGAVYKRRAPVNKYGEAIYYSRSDGKDDNGDVNYVRLIIFKDFGDVDPVTGSTAQKLQGVQAAKPVQQKQPVQEPQKRNPIPQEPTAEKPEFMHIKEYKEKSESKTFGISWDVAKEIAKMAGVMTAEQDFSQAVPYLPYFAEALANGVEFEVAKSILLECETLSDATASMRRNYPHQEPIL